MVRSYAAVMLQPGGLSVQWWRSSRPAKHFATMQLHPWCNDAPACMLHISQDKDFHGPIGAWLH